VFTIPYWVLWTACGVLVVLISITVTSWFGLPFVFESATLNPVKMHKDMATMQQKIDLLYQKEAEIRHLLSPQQPLQSPIKSGRARRFSEAELATSNGSVDEAIDSFEPLKGAFIDQKHDVATLVHLFDSHLKKAKDLEKKFHFTPSIWPLFGRIESGFGWRVHPVQGGLRFHSGVDIPAWVGAPIKSAADGKVIKVGWADALGNIVIVSHLNGYETVYGHTSRILVKEGQKVSKGQLIAQVGATGMTTGPHLHYEVRYKAQPISPLPFLNLDMYTAQAQVW